MKNINIFISGMMLGGVITFIVATYNNETPLKNESKSSESKSVVKKSVVNPLGVFMPKMTPDTTLILSAINDLLVLAQEKLPQKAMMEFKDATGKTIEEPIVSLDYKNELCTFWITKDGDLPVLMRIRYGSEKFFDSGMDSMQSECKEGAASFDEYDDKAFCNMPKVKQELVLKRYYAILLYLSSELRKI